ncbi:hypothetical protein L465_03667 [Enterobacter sp. BIDMC 29]|nr:hypothetical protein L465_03667 [Enterobacter sp. BIDMC 29]
MMLAIPASACSATTQTGMAERDGIDTLLNAPLFSQSHMNLSFKNYWKYLKEEENGPKKVHNAWGQGVAVDYQSGYFDDIIGFDATYYGVVKLGASDYFNSRGILYNNGSGNNKSNAEGFSKIGQRNVKLQYQLADVNLNARGGWQTIKTLGVISNSTRLSPTTYLGWTGAVNYDSLTLRGAYIESSMERNSPDKKRFQTNSGQYINHIASGDVLWQTEQLNVQYGYGESENYLRRHILFTNIKPINRLNIGTQVYATHALDDYKAMPANQRDFDNNAWHFAVDAKWQMDSWSTKWGLGYTDANKANEVGYFSRHMSKNSRGTFISMAYAGNDYMRDGELVLSNISDYNLTPALAIGLAGNIAQFNYRGNAVRTGEINVFSRWVPTHPGLKNLTVWAMLGPGWSYKMNGKTPVLTDGHYSRANSLASEIIIEYKFNLF